jgi:hypothetical protein
MHDLRASHLALLKRVLRSSSTVITATSTGLDAQIHVAQRRATASSSGSPSSHGRASASLRCPGPVSRPNITLLPMQLLGELQCRVDKASVAFCDNKSLNPVHHRRTKHIKIDIHFVRERVAVGELRVLPSGQQLADIMTKGLSSSTFCDFQSSLCVVDPPA